MNRQKEGQRCEVYAAGMVTHVEAARDLINTRIEEGWVVQHVLVISSGSLLVIYQRQEGSVVDMPTDAAGQLPPRSAGRKS